MCLRSRKDVTLIEEMAVDFTKRANKAFFAGERYFMQMEDSTENDLFVSRRKYRGKWKLYKPNDGTYRECSSAYFFKIDFYRETLYYIRQLHLRCAH